MLDVQSTSKGALLPRMTAAQQDAMDASFGASQQGMVVYITDTDEYQFWDGTQWVVLLGDVEASNGLTVNAGGAIPDIELGGDLEYDTQLRSGAYNLAMIVNATVGGGRIAIGSTSLVPDDLYSLTVERPSDNNTVKIGGDLYGIHSSVNANTETAIHAENTSTSTASAYYALSAQLSTPSTTTGYLGYHTSGNNSYAVYGTGGTYSGYFSGGTWGGYFGAKTVVTSATPPTSISDFEVQNTTSGSGNPATISLRQTTSNSTSANILANLNFGDNYSTGPQAQIQALRSAAGGASDWPSSLVFSTTPDGSTTLTEGMRLIHTGNLGIGITAPVYKLDVNSNATAPAIRGYYSSAQYGFLGSATYGGYFHAGTAGSTESYGYMARNNYEGVYGYAYNDDGIEGHTASSLYFGVSGINDAAAGTGIYGSGGTYGMYGYTPSTANGTYGIYGAWSSGRYGYLGGKTSSGYYVGAYGTTSGAGDYGVIGYNTNASGTGSVGGGTSSTPFQYTITCNMADSKGENGLVSKFADLRFEPAPTPLKIERAALDQVPSSETKWKQDPNEGSRPAKKDEK